MSDPGSDIPNLDVIRYEALRNDVVFLSERLKLDAALGCVVLMRSGNFVAQFSSEDLAESAAWMAYPDGVFSIHIIDEGRSPASMSAVRR